MIYKLSIKLYSMKKILHYISLMILTVHAFAYFIVSDEEVLKIELELFIRDLTVGLLFGLVALSTKTTKNDEE